MSARAAETVAWWYAGGPREAHRYHAQLAGGLSPWAWAVRRIVFWRGMVRRG